MYSVTRYHDISAGHRVVGHENKCRHLHGHNYRVHFTCVSTETMWGDPEGSLDAVGRVIDFGVIKKRLCMWLEEVWDHRTLLWEADPYLNQIIVEGAPKDVWESFIFVPFNPTAENMARFLVEVVGPAQLKGTGVTLQKVVIDETAKCSASFEVWP